MSDSNLNPILTPFTRDENRFSNRDLAQDIANLKSGTDNISGVGLGIVQTYNVNENTADVLLESGSVSTLDNGLGIAVAENDRVVYSLYKGSKINGAIVGIIDLANFGGGGVSAIYKATAQQQILKYNSGNVLLDSSSIIVSALNSTLSVIDNNDIVIVAEALSTTSNQYTIVGIISRVNTLTPVSVSPTPISPNFPLRTDNLYFNILDLRDLTTSMLYVGYDLNNSLGLGNDSIIAVENAGRYSGLSPNLPYINCFNRTNSTVHSLASNIFSDLLGEGKKTFVDSNGRIIFWDNTAASNLIGYTYKNNNSSLFINPYSSLPNNDPIKGSLDHSNEIFWTYNESTNFTSPPLPLFQYREFWRFGPNDTTPVNLGNLGIFTNSTSTIFKAANGWLYFSPSSNENYIKTSSGTDNWVSISTGSMVGTTSRGEKEIAIDTSGNVWMINSSSNGLVYLDKATGTITNYTIGITVPNIIDSVVLTQAGTILLTLTIEESTVGGSAGVYVPALVEFDGVSSSTVLFWDSGNSTTSVSTTRMSPPIEITAGTVRFYSISSNGTYFHEVTGV